MNMYLITYDLKNSDKNSYSTLYEAIQNIGSWWRYFDSSWIVKTDKTAQEILDLLLPHVNRDAGDLLFIIKVDAENTEGLLPKKAWDWFIKPETAEGNEQSSLL